MGEHVRAKLALLTLDKLYVRLHALCRECLREQVRDVPIRVQAAELKSVVNKMPGE